MKYVLILVAALLITGCATAPDAGVTQAEWEQIKTARTEARRPPHGSIVANPLDNPEDFEELKKQTTQVDPFTGW